MNDNLLRDAPVYHAYHAVQEPYRGGTGVYLGGTPTALCEGRLTLQSNTPVTVSDINTASTLYFTPYNGRRIALYDGVSAWNVLSFQQLSVSTTGLTVSTMYDIFVYNKNGTVTLDAPVAWTSTSARSVALALQDGVWVKSTNYTHRYIGTVYVASNSGSPVFSDSGTSNGTINVGRHVFNAYNRIPRGLQAYETGFTYSTNSTTPVAPATTPFITPYTLGLQDQLPRVAWQCEAYVNSTAVIGYVGLGPSTGGYYATAYRAINLTTFHTESGETFLQLLGLNTPQLYFWVSNSTYYVTLYQVYSYTNVAASLMA
jgi:hypothetical protein